MGSSNLGKLNNMTSQTAGWGLKINNKTRQQQASGKAKQVKQRTLGC